MKNIFLILLGVSFSFSCSAMNQWSLSEDGTPSVISEQGRLMLMIGKSREGENNVYIVPNMVDSNCKGGKVFNPKQAYSAEFNGVLIKLADACNGETHYFYPLTTKGTNFIINSLMTKTSVYLKQGDFSENISTENFREVFNTYNSQKLSSGGL